MRILLLIIIGLLLYLVFRNLWQRSNLPRIRPNTSQKMVRCEHCGLHILPDEAIRKSGLYFCSAEHLEAHDPHH